MSTQLRVTHCPVNFAGLPWTNVEALRRRGVDARLVVFERGKLFPEADISLDRPRGFLRRQAVQWPALARLLPQTDIFHFYFGLTLVPKSLQFPILRAARKKSIFHFLGSDIRGHTLDQLAYGRRADAQVVGSFDAQRWVPEAEVIVPGIELGAFTPIPPTDRARPLVVHAPSNRVKKGTEHVIAACERLPVDLDIVEGVHHDEARRRCEAADIIVDQVHTGWHGLLAIESMAMGKPVITYLQAESVSRTEEAFGMKIPIVSAGPDTLLERLGELVESPEERRRIGAAGRTYVEHVHDIERVVDRLLDLYARL